MWQLNEIVDSGLVVMCTLCCGAAAIALLM